MRALIGHTGFVGSHLAREFSFNDCYDSRNIQSIRGKSYDEIYCCGAPGAKWLANKNPEADWKSVSSLIQSLKEVSAKKFILISTVDTYGNVGDGRDETAPCDLDSHSPYGRHRWELERFVEARFPPLILRLPLLFGRGLKKNVLYDLIHGERLDQINRSHSLQWYNLENLKRDIQATQNCGLSTINLVSEPLSLGVLVDRFFDSELGQVDLKSALHYNITTAHADKMGGNGHYIRSSEEILDELQLFISQEGSNSKFYLSQAQHKDPVSPVSPASL